MHQFFIKYPILLPLYCPYGNIVFSKLKLTDQHIVDFAFARDNSPGVTWYFIEIKKPTYKQYTKKGDPTKELNHGVRQLHDWERWYIKNQSQLENYFPFKKEVAKIGLAINPELKLIFGRRKNVKPIVSQIGGSNIQVISFDRLKKTIAWPNIHKLKPIKVCSFVNGKVKTLSTLKINLSNKMEVIK